MSEEKKNITAKDLLSRLGKSSSAPVPEKPAEKEITFAEDTSYGEKIKEESAPEAEEAEIIAEAEKMQIELPGFIEEEEEEPEEEYFPEIPTEAADFLQEDDIDEELSGIEFPSFDFPEPGEETVIPEMNAEDLFDEEPEIEETEEPVLEETEEPEPEEPDFGEEYVYVPDDDFDPDEGMFGEMELDLDGEGDISEEEYDFDGDDADISFEEEDIPELTDEEEIAFEEAAGLADATDDADEYSADMYEGENYDEYAENEELADEIDEDFGRDITEDYYDGDSADIIPDESFFDEDPIGDEPEIAEDETVYDENGDVIEPDREEEFKNLVEEVTGDSDDTELTENDISLMVALGMEDELAKTVGEETASQMTEDYVADQEEWVDRTNRFGAGEYSDPSENGEIAEMYKKRNKFAILKLLGAIVLAIVLLFMENLPVMGYQLSGALDPAVYPVVYIMIDLQITLLCAALVWKNIKRGFVGLAKFKVTVDSIPALIMAMSVVAAIVASYTAIPGEAVSVFNFPAALTFVLTACNEYLTVRREIFSFNVISSKKRKFVMRNLSTRDSLLESEAVSDLELESTAADEGDIIKIQETDFVDGYFWRSKNRSTANDGYIGLSIVIALALAVMVAVYAGITKKTPAVSAGYATFMAAIPALMMVIGAYPFFIANRNAYENDSTIIGEGSVEEYSGVGVLSFDDVNVFRSQNVKVKNVRLFNNSRIDKVLYYAASVFSATGGPLADVFEVATMETGHSDDVKVLETGTGYIEAEVNGKNIVFGRAAALAKLGIIIPDDVISDNSELPADCSVMYMIYQRKLVSKMVVNYVIEPDFEYVLKELTGSGMCVCVKTFDPNIDEEMIYRQLHSSGKYSMRVIKYKTTDEISKYAKRAEGGIVSRGNTKALLRTVSVCDKILSAQKTGYIIGILSAIFGAAIVAVMLISGSFADLHSLYIALCQLLWLIPAVISTRLIVK